MTPCRGPGAPPKVLADGDVQPEKGGEEGGKRKEERQEKRGGRSIFYKKKLRCTFDLAVTVELRNPVLDGVNDRNRLQVDLMGEVGTKVS